MQAEHLIFAAAIAVIAGMLSLRYTGRDSSWIIILVSFAPDLDIIAHRALAHVGFTVIFEGRFIQHGTFHNITVMILFALMLAFLLHPFGIRFIDTIVFASIGFGAHLLEDSLVYAEGYMYLWPLSTSKHGLAWLVNGTGEPYNPSLFSLASPEVVVVALLFLALAIIIRTTIEGRGWIRWYLPSWVYSRLFSR